MADKLHEQVKAAGPILMSRSQCGVCEMECTGEDIFIVFNGVRIAKRGDPNTPQAKTWVSLEPGWRVLDEPDGSIFVLCEPPPN